MTRRAQRVSVSASGAGSGPQTTMRRIEADEAIVGPGVVVGRVGVADALGRQHIEVVVDGWRFETVVEDADRAELRERATRDRTDIVALDGPLEVRAIIPGRVVEVRVTAGDVVEAGQALLVVEAMKMQNELRAPRSGAVTRVVAAVGSTVEVGDLLLVLG